ncbi:MAG: YbgC/FadM family acyl-CoA thioesterase [Nitrospira sp.]|nr:YbgC/FadM family acyl-CoA thioesterase [Nitrospira sp.]
MRKSMHKLKIKIYYEDTDAGGLVYYANYLRFMERGRTELLSDKGIDVAEYHSKGYFFPVVHVDISYRRPAKLGEIIEVATEVVEITNATTTFKQEILRDNAVLVEATVKLACINRDGKPQKIPSGLASLFSDRKNNI